MWDSNSESRLISNSFTELTSILPTEWIVIIGIMKQSCTVSLRCNYICYMNSLPCYCNAKWIRWKARIKSQLRIQAGGTKAGWYLFSFCCFTISLPEVCSTCFWSDSAGVCICTRIMHMLLWLIIIPGISAPCCYQWEATSTPGVNCQPHRFCISPAVYLVLVGLILNVHILGWCKCTLPLLVLSA